MANTRYRSFKMMDYTKLKMIIRDYGEIMNIDMKHKRIFYILITHFFSIHVILKSILT